MIALIRRRPQRVPGRARVGHELLPSRTFGYGHPFGVLSHYYGREAGLELRETSTTT